jgi:hypothetical protein
MLTFALYLAVQAAAVSTRVSSELLASLNLSDDALLDTCTRDAHESWDIPVAVQDDLLGRKLIVFEHGCGLNGVRAVLAGAALTYSVHASVGVTTPNIYNQVQ